LGVVGDSFSVTSAKPIGTTMLLLSCLLPGGRSSRYRGERAVDRAAVMTETWNSARTPGGKKRKCRRASAELAFNLFMLKAALAVPAGTAASLKKLRQTALVQFVRH